MDMWRNSRFLPLFSSGALVAFLIAFVEPAARAQDSEKLLAAVRQAAGKRQMAGQTATIKWTLQETTYKGSVSKRFPPPFTQAGDIQPPQDTTHDGSGVLLLNGEQARISRTAMVWHLSQRRFNKDQTESLIKGKQYSSLVHYGSQQWPQGRLSKNGWRHDAEIIIWPALLALRGNDEQIVMGNGFDSYTTVRKFAINGQACIELTQERTDTAGERKILLNDNPDQGYPFKQMDIFHINGMLALRTEIIANRLIDGLAYPTEWKISSFNEKSQEYLIIVKINEFNLHPRFTGDDFSLNFPAGTYVVDAQEQETHNYIVRPDGSHRVVLPEEIGAGYDALVGPPAPSARRGQHYSHILAWVGGALIVLAGALAVIRWKRRRVSKEISSS